jgi:hypothetical protein
MWKEDYASISETAAKALASPSENPDLFADHDIALQVEQMFMAQRAATAGSGIPASDYKTAKDDLELNLIDLLKQRAAPPIPATPDPVKSPEVDAVMVDVGEVKAEDPDGEFQDAAMSESEALKAEEARIEAEQLRIAEEAVAAEAEQARLAAEQIAIAEEAAAAEAQRLEEARLAEAAAEAAKEDDVDDFGDDW